MWDGLQSILVVDDDPVIRGMLQELLELEGYHVETASTAYDGLSRLVANGVDLSLVHLTLPDFGAVDFCHQVRYREHGQWLQGHRRHLPIIVTSAWVEDERRQVAIAAGADAYLLKPFDTDELLAHVKRLLTSPYDASTRAPRALSPS